VQVKDTPSYACHVSASQFALVVPVLYWNVASGPEPVPYLSYLIVASIDPKRQVSDSVVAVKQLRVRVSPSPDPATTALSSSVQF